MRALSRFLFVLVVLFNLVISQFVVAAVAMNDDYGTTYKVTYYQLPYGNGVDDNGDGVIDDMNESDVVYGERNITQSDRVIDSWSQNFSFPSPHEYGVEIGGSFERLYEVSVNAVDPASSVSPTQSCYYVNETDKTLNYTIKTNVIDALDFYMQLTPEGLMNGASEIWYRSALVWDNKTFDQYYLNIFEENKSGGPSTLIYATTDSGTITTPHPYVIYDRSNQSRIYQKLNIDFKTNTRYIFREYIQTKDNIPLNSVKLFFADFQDIGKDNETSTYVFQGSPYANKIVRECSWSMVPIIGIGPAGIEIPIWSNTHFNATYYPQILTSKIVGGNSELNVTSANFTIPMRCTQKTNFTIYVKTWSGTHESTWILGYKGTTYGSIIVGVNVSDPDPTQPNIYQLAIRFTNLNTSDNAVLFKIYPSAGSICGINYNSSYTDVYHFASHVELVTERHVKVIGNKSPDWAGVLIGIGIVLIGVGILVLTWETAVGFGLGIQTIIGGGSVAYTAYLAVGFTAGILVAYYGTLSTYDAIFHTNLANGYVRALLSFVEGLYAIGKAVWNVLIQLIEAIKWFINAIMTWGGDILWAVAEVIYFVAFIFVLSLWGIFLSTMRYIAVGDIEGAWASLKKPFLKSYRWVRKRPVYKVARTAATTAVTKGVIK